MKNQNRYKEILINTLLKPCSRLRYIVHTFTLPSRNVYQRKEGDMKSKILK